MLALADATRVALQCIAGIAEEVPLPDRDIDVAFSAVYVNHMTTEKALPETAWVLRPGGRSATVEPWRAPLFRALPSFSIVQHGILGRYPMLAPEKFVAHFSLSTAWAVSSWDDQINSALKFRRFGGGVALLGRK